jgi:hypothetical protein
MKWEVFLQIIIVYILLLISIIIFNALGLDINFIVSFIFAIVTLAISIFFFAESNKLSNSISERILLLKKDVENLWWNIPKMKDLNISPYSNIKVNGGKKE